MLRNIFESIPEKRRAQGRMYKAGDILFLSILAILSGGTSYRKMHTFMEAHLNYLKKRFKIKWKKSPSYSTIRKVIHQIDPEALEKAMREHSRLLSEKKTGSIFVNLDGKCLRGSFDHFEDEKAIQVFSAFLTGENIVLAHEEIRGQKTNEIPIAQELIQNLGLENCIFTSDAMHCQKKQSKR
jgi:hypothetical protein